MNERVEDEVGVRLGECDGKAAVDWVLNKAQESGLGCFSRAAPSSAAAEPRCAPSSNFATVGLIQPQALGAL